MVDVDRGCTQRITVRGFVGKDMLTAMMVGDEDGDGKTRWEC